MSVPLPLHSPNLIVVVRLSAHEGLTVHLVVEFLMLWLHTFQGLGGVKVLGGGRGGSGGSI